MGSRRTINGSNQLGVMLGRKEAESMISAFNPDVTDSQPTDVWIRSVEETFRQCNIILDGQKLLIASMRLEGPAKTWHEAMKADFPTWTSLKEGLCNYFPAEVDNLAVHRQLANTRMKSDESVESYAYGKLALARKIALDDKTLRMYIIQGIPGHANRAILSAGNYETIPELVRAVKRLNLKPDEKEKDRYPQRRAEGYRRQRRTDRRPYQREDRGESNRKSDYRDNPRWKIQKEKKKKCFKCDAVGHFVAQCPRNKDFRVRLVEPTAASRKTNNQLRVKVGNNAWEMDALLDTGSDITLLKEEEWKKLQQPLEGPPLKIRAYAGHKAMTQGSINTPISTSGVTRAMTVHVVPDMYQDCPLILGKDFFHDESIEASISRKGVHVSRKRTRSPDVHLVHEGTPSKVPIPSPITAEEVRMGDMASEQEREELVSLMNSHRKCFAKNIGELGASNIVSMKVELKEKKVIRYPPYRVPYQYRRSVQEEIQRLLEAGIIEPSTSEYASPMVVQKKKQGGLRICVDYRLLNAIIQKEHHPMPNIEEEIHKLQGKKVFTSLDLMMGYHQLPVDPESRKYLAFVTPEAQYTYTKVPFGLANSPAVFMRAMDKVLASLDRSNISCFVDDLLIATDTVEENMRVLEKFLTELEKHGFTLKTSKCEFFKSSIGYLGHEINGEGVSPGLLKTKAITECKAPTNVKELRRFLGLTGYFRKFVPDYAGISKPLRMLLKKGAVFTWDGDQQRAFETIKEKLVSNPTLLLYSPTAQHELHTDASKSGLAGVLMQMGDDNRLHPVAYFSRATTPAESRYSSYELETLAVVESMERFRYFLLGKDFTVVTDCRSLQQSQKSKHLIPRIARWWTKIMAYDFTVEHRAGSKMAHVDCLSRAPVEPAVERDEPMVLSLGLDDESWIAAIQLNDGQIARVKGILNGDITTEKDEKNIKNQFVLVEGCVYKKTKSGLKFFVPAGLRFYVMRAAHDDMGHPALDRTLQAIRKTYWFPKMEIKLRKYISNCISCGVNKRGTDETNHHIHVLPKKEVPFHTVHIDFCGKFPQFGKKEHIVGVIDAFTRFTVLRAVPAPTSKCAIAIITEIAQYFGMPSQIVSDNGTAFKSEEFLKFCRDNSIQSCPVAVATPRANGQIERVFRTVKDSLTCLSSKETGTDWVKNLPVVQWALNALENRVTGESPQNLLLGYTPRNVLGNQLLNVVSAAIERESEEPASVEEIRAKAAKRMHQKQRDQAESYNENHRLPRKYMEGELVLLRFNPAPTGGSRKMMPRYRGPYIVKEVLDRDRYLIADTPVTQITQRPFLPTVYPADKLKPCGDVAELAALEEECFGDDDDCSNEEN